MEKEITIKIDDGEIEKVKEPEQDDDRLYVSSYARFFNETNPAWNNDSEMNMAFLLAQQEYANAVLRRQDYLFLNEVYDMLGIPRSRAGQVVGWIYDENNPEGDNYVDFDLYSKRNEDFVNGYEKSALLDFNVDGIILDKIP